MMTDPAGNILTLSRVRVADPTAWTKLLVADIEKDVRVATEAEYETDEVWYSWFDLKNLTWRVRGAADRALVILDRVKVRTLLLVMVAGTEGKLLRVRVFRLGVRVMVAKLTLLTDTDRNYAGRMNSMVSV